ncbi:MAG: hypothetical protein MZV49_02685 [Rhodopseudomonas palustris]|nr:hypothetical protein [Rhodopseudomonas palustris]
MPAVIVTHLVRRKGHRPSCSILSQVVLEPATAVRGGAAGDVHRQPRQMGRSSWRRAG